MMHAPHPITAEALRFGTTRCALGTALVAASEAGIVAILLGDDTAALTRELARSFPDARLIEDAPALAATLDVVAAFLDAPHTGLDLPLDMRGPDEARAVWRVLRQVPPGELVTYGVIAKTLGMTAQEVGAACAANTIAVAIPCHRVVKADGGISGYRWGVHRKKRLINREAVLVAS